MMPLKYCNNCTEANINNKTSHLISLLSCKLVYNDLVPAFSLLINVMILLCGQRFTGGITNTLLGCWHKDDLDQEEMVLIRIYGANTDLIIDRAAEIRNIQLLHAVGCARPLYARFANGIVYGFFPGECVDEITVQDPVISRSVMPRNKH